MSFSERIKDEILAEKFNAKQMVLVRYGGLVTESNELKVLDLKKQVKTNSDKKAFLKGIFLESGCVTDPNKDYHFEISVKTLAYQNFVLSLIEDFGISPKSIKRKSNYIIYLKDSEMISTMLKVLNASKAVLEFENIRISKSLKNDINRAVNCEASNISKIAKSSYMQVSAINKVINSGKFDKLDEKLKDAASLRLKYQDLSLDELVTKANFKTSKSGLYHRLAKIIKLSEEE